MKITFEDVEVGGKVWCRLRSLLDAAAEDGCEVVCAASAAKLDGVLGSIVESGTANGYMLKEGEG